MVIKLVIRIYSRKKLLDKSYVKGKWILLGKWCIAIRVSKNTDNGIGIGIHENTEIPIGISVFIGSFQIMKESFDGVFPNWCVLSKFQ
jgi:hypothetical protein